MYLPVLPYIRLVGTRVAPCHRGHGILSVGSDVVGDTLGNILMGEFQDVPCTLVVEGGETACRLSPVGHGAGTGHDTIVRDAPCLALLAGAQQFYLAAHQVPAEGIGIVGVIDIHATSPLSVG